MTGISTVTDAIRCELVASIPNTEFRYVPTRYGAGGTWKILWHMVKEVHYSQIESLVKADRGNRDDARIRSSAI